MKTTQQKHGLRCALQVARVRSRVRNRVVGFWAFLGRSIRVRVTPRPRSAACVEDANSNHPISRAWDVTPFAATASPESGEWLRHGLRIPSDPTRIAMTTHDNTEAHMSARARNWQLPLKGLVREVPCSFAGALIAACSVLSCGADSDSAIPTQRQAPIPPVARKAPPNRVL